MAEQDVMRFVLPGGGFCRILVEGEFGPRQMRAAINMLKVAADVLSDEDDIDTRRALAQEPDPDA